MLACLAGQTGNVSQLLSHPQLDIDVKNDSGDTALVLANRYGFKWIADQIEEAKLFRQLKESSNL